VNSRHSYRIKNDSQYRSTGLNPLFKLSATMVELSLQHIEADSRSTISSGSPTNIKNDPAAPPVERINANSQCTVEDKCDSYQLAHGWSLQRYREVLRKCSSRMHKHCANIYGWLRVRVASVELVVLGLTFVLAFLALRGPRPGPVKALSQNAPTVPQHETPAVPLASVTSEKPHDDVRTGEPGKVKPHHRRDDYVAKDTYVDYEKESTTNH
jgi:hypothetical protein